LVRSSLWPKRRKWTRRQKRVNPFSLKMKKLVCALALCALVTAKKADLSKKPDVANPSINLDLAGPSKKPEVQKARAAPVNAAEAPNALVGLSNLTSVVRNMTTELDKLVKDARSHINEMGKKLTPELSRHVEVVAESTALDLVNATGELAARASEFLQTLRPTGAANKTKPAKAPTKSKPSKSPIPAAPGALLDATRANAKNFVVRGLLKRGANKDEVDNVSYNTKLSSSPQPLAFTALHRALFQRTYDFFVRLELHPFTMLVEMEIWTRFAYSSKQGPMCPRQMWWVPEAADKPNIAPV
jgi:hypothetical protein